MRKKLVLLILLLGPLSFFLGGIIYYRGNVSLFFSNLTKTIQPSIATAQSFFTPIINAWNNLPASIKGLATLSIPTFAAIFFAWTKNRAMQNLQQTKLEAATQVGTLTTELTDAKTAAYSALQEKQTLATKLSVYEKEGVLSETQKQFNEMQDKYLDSQAELKRTKDQLTQANTERAMLEKDVKDLKDRIERLINPQIQ